MGKRKKTSQEIADDNQRTNSMGLFNTAEAYWMSAGALEAAKVKVGQASQPVRFLYYHAIELYLKALLRQHHSVQKLEGKFRHDVKRMRKGAEALGLSITGEDRQVFDKLRDPDVLLEARYIRTGPKAWPNLEELDRTCKSLRLNVGRHLRENGVMVRI
jgi:hypothetical protein